MEQVTRFAKNILLVCVKSNQITNEVESPCSSENLPIDSKNPLELMKMQRNEFQTVLFANKMYKNKKFPRPWKLLSSISDEILLEIADSVRKQSVVKNRSNEQIKENK